MEVDVLVQAGLSDCGPYALMNALQVLDGRQIDPYFDALGKEKGPFFPAELDRRAIERGLQTCWEVRPSKLNWRHHRIAIGLVSLHRWVDARYWHWVVILPLSRSRYVLLDSIDGGTYHCDRRMKDFRAVCYLKRGNLPRLSVVSGAFLNLSVLRAMVGLPRHHYYGEERVDEEDEDE